MRAKVCAMIAALSIFNFVAMAETVSLSKFEELCAEQIKSSDFTVSLIERDADFQKAEDEWIRSTHETPAVYKEANKKYKVESAKEITPRTMSLSDFSQHVARESYLTKVKDQMDLSLDPRSIYRGVYLEAPRDFFDDVKADNVDWVVTNKKVVRSGVRFDIVDKTNSQKIFIGLKTGEFPLIRNPNKDSVENYLVDVSLPIDCKFQLDTRFDNIYLDATSTSKVIDY